MWYGPDGEVTATICSDLSLVKGWPEGQGKKI